MYVIINGVSSDTIQGLQVLSLPPITKPKMRRQVDTIDGRAGDIITELGYEAYDRTITVLLHHTYDLDAITAFFNTSGEIIFSNEPDKKYYFRLLEKIDYERAVQFKTANVTFHVQPYKYPVSETPLTVSTTAWEGTDYDQTPYIFRAVSDSSVEVGNREIVEQITGGTVAWNQLYKDEWWYQSQTTAYGLTLTPQGDGSTIINGTVSGKPSTGQRIYIAQSSIGTSFFHYIQGHKYIYLCPTLPSGVSGYTVLTGNTATTGYKQSNGPCVAEARQTADTYCFGGFEQIENGAVFSNFRYYLNVIDLTQMFGSTIADYIYSLETATAGAGVSLFKSLFPKDYYVYNAGELMSVKTSARETTGKNLCPMFVTGTTAGLTFTANTDGSIRIAGTNTGTAFKAVEVTLPKGTYKLTGSPSGGQLTLRNALGGGAPSSAFSGTFDSVNGAESTFAVSETATAWLNIRVVAGTHDDVYYPMIREASAPTGYEPYEKHTYPLSNIELRGIPKLVNNKLTYDGDIYKADGSVTRRFGIVDLGTLSWTKSSDSAFYSTNVTNFARVKTVGQFLYGNAMTSKYVFTEASSTPAGTFSLFYNTGYSGNRLFVFDDFTGKTATEVKESLSGVYLVYELATPTTETTTPYTETQICSPYGTESFVDDRDVQIPVGHKTRYMQINDPAEIIVPNAGNVPSAPTIQMTGSGTVGVYLGNAQTLQVTIPEDGITIDTEAQDATSNGQLANRSVTGDYDSVRLQPGDNDVSFSGDVSAVITKYTRWV